MVQSENASFPIWHRLSGRSRCFRRLHPENAFEPICFRPYGNETDWIMDLFWKVFSEIMVQFVRFCFLPDILYVIKKTPLQ